MKRVAVLGIDGSGKSTIVRRLAGPGTITLTCPEYHQTPDAPLSDLSRSLDTLSRLADSLGSFELKATAMYLQMTLYGPIESFFAETFKPAILVSEHHPIIDSLAYAPFYAQRVTRDPDRAALEPQLRERLGAGFESVLRWHPEFWVLATQITELFRKPAPQVLKELVRRYRTGLPDVAVFLDVPVTTALARLKDRGGRELHESAEALDALRRSTVATLMALKDSVPAFDVRMVDTSKPLDDTLADVAKVVAP